ncbi:tRNA-splicing endonuclease subunit Sen15 [Denticeps clupeoides]|uniref:tRNA-splicing endonuclease subunit Sen15 domain-containing protein n=1 Tax=Denticeps clupeoides TaxID=299321 RepID=A0AAY4BDB3_9TELE|nr:tRNA-splicing endonuclease subunit Sen15 [Denticeps clupeoides]
MSGVTGQTPLPSDWILRHPAYQDMMQLEVGDSAQIHAAFLVYLDLTEVRRWKEVLSFACSDLEAVLLEGQEKEGAAPQILLPLPAHRTLSHREIRCVLRRGAAALLSVVASDSTIVYQRMCDGLLTPDPPGSIQDQGRRQHRKRRVPP